MRDRAEVVVIGGGVVGCAIAYNLAKLGLTDVVLVEKGYLACGSSGRCAGGIRQQWSTPENARMAMASVRLFEGLADELGYPTEYTQGGYLILAYTEDEVAQYRRNVAMQQGLGLDVRFLSPAEARDVVPCLNIDGVLAATYCPTDGKANPFLVTRGYALAAQRLGVEVNLRTTVTGIEVADGRVQAVVTDKGRIAARWVVNAAGGYAAAIGALAGLDVPVQPVRHEILVTEPVEPLFDPLIISFYYGTYIVQAPHGGILMGQGDPDEPVSYSVRSGLPFARSITAKMVRLIPCLKDVKVVRQWAGLYEMTPDAQPILGPVDGLDGYIQAVGFSGHGFMVAPITGQLIAEYIVKGETSLPIDELGLGRFAAGAIRREASVV